MVTWYIFSKWTICQKTWNWSTKYFFGVNFFFKTNFPINFFRIFNGTGKVLYSSRITLTLDCPMVLTNFPFDTQKCSIDFAPFAYTTSDIVYSWKNIHPIQIKDRLFHSFQNFIFSTSFPGKCTSVTNTGTYSCLEAIFVFKRDFKFYLSQIYILRQVLQYWN